MGDNNEAYEMRLKGGGGAGKRRASMLYPLIFGPLYFFSVAIAIPASPALINTIISGDNTPTPQGQMKLGSLLATDAFFTLLTTNIWAVMSDKYGRKPFLAMSAAGIGIGAMIVGCSSSFAPMYIGAAIDGCTSCMFGLGQAYLCDFSEPSQLPANIGLFMGVSAGIGFTFGVPISAVLMKKKGPRASFFLSAALALVNTLIISVFLPESLPDNVRRDRIRLSECNPISAIHSLGRNGLLMGASISYFLLWFAHTGLQVTWMNFFKAAHGWSPGKSGGILALFGIATAILPRLILKFVTLATAVKLALAIYAAAMLLLSQAKGDVQVYMALVLASVGSTALPSSLSFLANQATADAKGAMQGATETVKTINSILAQPLMSAVFAYGISEQRQIKVPGLMFVLGGGMLALSCAVFTATQRAYAHLDVFASP